MTILQRIEARFAKRWLCCADGDAGGGSAAGGAGGGGAPSPSGPGSSSAPATPSSPSAPSSPAPSAPSALKAVTPNVSTTREAGDEPDYDVFFGGAPAATPTSKPVEVLSAPPGSQSPAAAPPVVEAVVPPQVPVAPTAAPAAPPSAGQEQPPQAPVQAGPPQLDTSDPMVLANEMRRLEPEMMQHVAQSVFALSPEDVNAINQGDPASVVPTLMARAFIKSQQNTLELLGRLLPQMLQKHSDQTKRHGANEDKFYKRWTGIDKEKHGATVMKYAAVYRQMHPTTSLDQMIEDLGPMIMMAARITPGAQPNGSNGAAVAPTPAPGFVPALGGPAGVATPVEGSPWDVLAPR